MSCLPNTPIATDVRDDGWQSFTTILTTTAAQWKPISESVPTFEAVIEAESQSAVIRQVSVEETAASSGDLKKQDLTLYVYNAASPTAPTAGTVYNPSTTNLVGQIQITASDYERTSDTVWTATINPNRYFTTGSGNLASNLYLVALYANATPTAYTASAAMRVRMWVENNAIV
jgi:hypothetical protein